MSKTPPALRRIQHVGLKVHDLDEAVAFYGDVMGLRVSDRYEPGDNPHSPWGICFMRCGEGHHEVSLIAYPKEAGLTPKEGDMRARPRSACTTSPSRWAPTGRTRSLGPAHMANAKEKSAARRESSSWRGRSSTAPRTQRRGRRHPGREPRLLFSRVIRAETASRFSATWPESTRSPTGWTRPGTATGSSATDTHFISKKGDDADPPPAWVQGGPAAARLANRAWRTNP